MSVMQDTIFSVMKSGWQAKQKMNKRSSWVPDNYDKRRK